eukprot:comp20426_c0_seq2/m.25927 comp20426_c0_seq2/g.25927  ORF comp20426_c0_seq2/g.25927 comp20426_c0_seq2/m.25927 type:complete len:408 (-) comp20426_c0_seq2:329-1552(-)
MAYRNFMIDTYRLNPDEYLTATACRRCLTGDVSTILKVHAFLEQWGLINYQVAMESRASSLGPPSTSHFEVSVDTPAGIQRLRMEEKPAGAVEKLYRLQDPKKKPLTKDTLMRTRPDIYAPKTKTVQCRQCNTVCAGSYFKTKTQPELELCVACFTDGKYPVELSGDQFVRMAVKDDSFKPWAQDETLRLLEGLEMHKDNWAKVAEHVGTRDAQECILHFIRLPIQDPYIDPGSTEFGPLRYRSQPFSESGNPIMSTVAFLASVVDPSVAAAGAQAALAEYSKLEGPTKKKSSDIAGREEGLKDAEAHELVSRAAATCLAAAAAKAKLLAEYEERQIRGLVAQLVEAQLKKIDIKLRQLDDIDAFMDSQYAKLEGQRKELLHERLQLKAEQLALAKEVGQSDAAMES